MAHQPQQLVATPISTTEITLSWTDVDTLEGETYDIERDSVVIEEGYAGGTTFTDTGLDPDTEYTYRVRASGGSEASGVSLSTVTTASTVLTPFLFTSPTDITGLVGWYDFSDISTLWQDTARTSAISADAQLIKGMTDKSGGGSHLSHASLGIVYKAAIRNGRSIGRCVAASGNYLLATGATLTGAFSGTDKALTSFLVVAQTTLTSGGVSYGAGRSSSNTPYHLPHRDNAAGFWRADKRDDASAGADRVSTVATDTSYHIQHAVYPGTTMSMYTDGVQGVNAGACNVGATTIDQFSLGAWRGTATNNAITGDIAECIVYNTALSAADQNLIGAYLADRWGLTWTTVT